MEISKNVAPPCVVATKDISTRYNSILLNLHTIVKVKNNVIEVAFAITADIKFPDFLEHLAIFVYSK